MGPKNQGAVFLHHRQVMSLEEMVACGLEVEMVVLVERTANQGGVWTLCEAVGWIREEMVWLVV
jgi:hypothetical protein